MNAEFAGRVRRELRVGRGQIYWIGRLRTVEVLIAVAEQARAALPDEPIGMLGTGLLSPHKLTMDFATRRVVITENEDQDH